MAPGAGADLTLGRTGSAVTRVLQVLVHNWPLKLAAIGLATLLYGGLVFSQSTQTFPDPSRSRSVASRPTRSCSPTRARHAGALHVAVGRPAHHLDLPGVDRHQRHRARQRPAERARDRGIDRRSHHRLRPGARPDDRRPRPAGHAHGSGPGVPGRPTGQRRAGRDDRRSEAGRGLRAGVRAGPGHRGPRGRPDPAGRDRRRPGGPARAGRRPRRRRGSGRTWTRPRRA